MEIKVSDLDNFTVEYKTNGLGLECKFLELIHLPSQKKKLVKLSLLNYFKQK